MRPRDRAAVALLVALLVGCGGEVTDTSVPVIAGDGAATPIDAVHELVDAMSVPDFADASRLAMPGHAALAALAEGASFSEVAAALRDGDAEIAANFWTGFAQETGSFLSGDIEVVDGETITREGIDFHSVVVTPASGVSREVIVRDEDGYRVDLFASFGAGLADRMSGQVERLLVTQTDDARLIMESLRGIVPSLLAAAQLPGTPPEVSQELLALVEVITRVG
jgi:hypothetical protein